MNRKIFAGAIVIALCLSTTLLAQKKQTRDEMVIGDRENVSGNQNWIYDDFEKALKVAEKEQKPLMVVLRCIP